MQLSVQEFLNSTQNPNTRKEYRYGIKKFVDYYGKSAEKILELRKDDLTQQEGENLVEYKNRASRFAKEIEKFHNQLLEQGYSTNTARNLTIGIRQLFRFYQMPVHIRAGSKVTKTIKTSRSFPLRIEHIRKMFAVADLRERVILSMATDLGLRISDFINLKKDDLPPLNQEPPIPFDVMTSKEEVEAHGFLSQETTELLKVYLPTIEKKKDNNYLFPSNGKSHISDEWLNKLLQRLAEKSKIAMNGKSLTFHCFRKMFLSTAIDSGIGLTAGKKLVGKAIPKSDDTYLTTIKLRQKFIQLKKFQSIKEQPRVETEKIESLKKAINTLQEELTRQKLITDTISEENIRTKDELKKLQPLVEFVNSFDVPEKLRTILNYLKEDYSDDRFRPLNVEFSPYMSKKLEEIARTLGITKREALAELVKEKLETMENGEEKFKKLEEKIKNRRKKS
jgi:integrase